MPGAPYWIQKLQLQQHIEGGWYSEVYRSSLLFPKNQLPPTFTGDRNACTHIYFLLEKKGFSAFHRIRSDEAWHFYAGDPLIIYEIDSTGAMKEHWLGSDPEKGHALFTVIAAGNWFASRVAGEGEYGLAGCTVSPGFDFADFEMARRNDMLLLYPQHGEIIRQMALQ